MFSLKKITSGRGSSLIIVLASLALLMVLVLGFLASVGTEFQSSKMYANGSSLKLLAQSSVNLVIGQLRVATADSTLCWTSQPGMLRTYNNQGLPTSYYKLYSDSSMQGTGAFDVSTSVVPPAWFDQKGVYVDLNQAATINGTNYYPILHGNPADYQTFTPPFDAGSGAGNARSMKPASGVGSSDIAGFWLRKDTPVDSTAPNSAPMPVKWLYVLQDGTIIVPNSTAPAGVVSFSGATKPSVANPIVGRMAFWTDDETAKVNINTASEGAFWDTPRTYTYQDFDLGVNQPLQGEFQRYPGHPAQVSMSTILPIQSPTAVWDPAPGSNGAPAAPAVTNEEFYLVTPATKPGGSVGGTVEVTAGTSKLTSSVSRLYTTVDEFLFQMTLDTASPKARKLNSAQIPAHPTALTTDSLRKSRFFLTANSQAPDVNVFNLPRVSMWPITLNGSGTPTMTPYDQLISFCTTVNKNIYYFQRKDPNSQTTDLPMSGSATGLGRNRQLLEYLRRLTDLSIPGFGSGKFSTKYGDDRQQILTEMFDYIRSTNLRESSVVPSVAYTAAYSTTASGTPSYRGGLGQVVPIVDMATSVNDTQNGGAPTHPRGFGRFPTLQQAALVFIGVRDGSDAPTGTPPVAPSPSKFVPASSMAPGFAGYPDANFAAIPAKSTSVPPATPDVQRVQAAFIIQTLDPSNGPTSVYPWYEVEVQGLDSLTWSNTAAGIAYPMKFPGTGVISKPYTVLQGTSIGGQNDYRIFTYGRGTGASLYPFVTPPTGALTAPPGSPGVNVVTCPDMTEGFIYLKGGNTITVSIYALNSGGTRDTTQGALQTFKLTFPACAIPVPQTMADSTLFSYAATKATTNFRSFYNEGANIGRFNIPLANAMFGSNDSIRALVATPGDMRVVAPRSVVPESFFQKLSNYDETVTNPTASPPKVGRMSHMLRFGYNFPVYGSLGSKLVNVNYSRYASPFLSNETWWAGSAGNPPPAASGATSGNRMRDAAGAVSTTAVFLSDGVTPGDWDNGISNMIDGGYINKADEGDAGVAGYKPYVEFDYSDGIPGASFFSPNKMIPSSGMFGSLPTGVWSYKPWQTLLFRPGPASHPGLGTEVTATSASSGRPASPPFSLPPDYLFMDLFGMPVVEPYAISTPLATSGRINMNYQIIPFTYIHRDTGLRAAMKAQMLMAIPSAAASNQPNYKNGINPVNSSPGPGNTSPGVGNAPANIRVRFPINLDATLAQFDAKFTNNNNVFRAPAEICAVDLVPGGTTLPAGLPATINRTNMDLFWKNSSPITGDNSREKPYANIYPLLTTKSNTYTVHFRVQLLKQVAKADMTVWKEGSDQVLSQYRGSQTIERFIDPNDTIPDYATETTFPPAHPLSEFYKFRVVSTQQFAP